MSRPPACGSLVATGGRNPGSAHVTAKLGVFRQSSARLTEGQRAFITLTLRHRHQNPEVTPSGLGVRCGKPTTLSRLQRRTTELILALSF
jgi:hypothetical protein